MIAPPPCPAVATGFAAVAPSAAEYAFQLSAAKPARVQGQVVFDTDRGWFAAQLPPIVLEASKGGALSRPLYVQFARSAVIRNAWFEAPGAACYPPQPGDMHRGSVPAPPPQSGDVRVRAAIREPYGRSDCGERFAPVRALTVVEPDIAPHDVRFPGTAEIDVTVGADGKAVDARLVQSSGTAAFDDAALAAAKATTYSPALAYCVPTAGTYRYKATSHIQ